MKIEAKLVKELRMKTGAGMMDCKNALLKSNGNLNDAIDHLRKSGITKAEKRVLGKPRKVLFIHIFMLDLD